MSRTPDGRISGRMDPLEVQVGDEEMFVSYTPSPRNAMEHLQRRNSTSAGCYARGPDPSIGNAKKVRLAASLFFLIVYVCEDSYT